MGSREVFYSIHFSALFSADGHAYVGGASITIGMLVCWYEGVLVVLVLLSGMLIDGTLVSISEVQEIKISERKRK